MYPLIEYLGGINGLTKEGVFFSNTHQFVRSDVIIPIELNGLGTLKSNISSSFLSYLSASIVTSFTIFLRYTLSEILPKLCNDATMLSSSWLLRASLLSASAIINSCNPKFCGWLFSGGWVI